MPSKYRPNRLSGAACGLVGSGCQSALEVRARSAASHGSLAVTPEEAALEQQERRARVESAYREVTVGAQKLIPIDAAGTESEVRAAFEQR